MLHTITKRLEICIDINTEISYVNHTWIFASRIFTLALEITFLLNKYFFHANVLHVTLTKKKT